MISSYPDRVAVYNAAKPIAKTTNLNVDIAATAYRNYSPIPLVKAYGFKPLIATANGYDKSRSIGPCRETRRRARQRPCRALARSQIAASGRQPATAYAHACCRSNRRGTVKANRPWQPYEDAAYGDGGGHDEVICLYESNSDANVQTFLK